MRTTPEERLRMRAAFDLDDSELGRQVIALLDDHDDQAGRISKAIDAAGDDGWIKSDAVRDMLAILGDPKPLPTYCAYCGHRVAGEDDAAASLITEHIRTCAKHPMRTAESERDEARRGLARWLAWHIEKQGTEVPPIGERPTDAMARRQAARDWGAEEALRLFPLAPGEALASLLE